MNYTLELYLSSSRDKPFEQHSVEGADHIPAVHTLIKVPDRRKKNLAPSTYEVLCIIERIGEVGRGHFQPTSAPIVIAEKRGI